MKLLPEGRGYLDLFSSPEQPPTASLHALDGSLQHWLVRNELDATHPYHEFLADHVKEEFGSIAAADGQQLNYRLLKPAKLEPGKRYPVVIDVYGGPHNQYIKQDWMGGARAPQGYFRQVLAQHGFVVFTLDNRGSGFRGNAFETALAGQFGKVEVADQLRGVEFLKTQAYVDPQRIGIMGWSYGGYMTLMALTHAPTRSKPASGRAGHGLPALRHALHRALPRHASAEPERLRSDLGAAAPEQAARQAAAGARHGR